jgi:hypothetical protein
MKYTLLLVALVLTSAEVLAFAPEVVEPLEPYAPIAITGDPYAQREYLGSLNDFPDMYEVTSETAFTLTLQVRQLAKDTPFPFGLIIIKQNENNGGVTEIGRFNPTETEWTDVSHSALGLSLLQSEVWQQEVEPGTYRIEISTPENNGNYMLVFGDEPTTAGYFETLSHIRTTQAHFGYSVFQMLFSSYVFYPLGILVILFGIFKTWQWRKKTMYVS